MHPSVHPKNVHQRSRHGYAAGSQVSRLNYQDLDEYIGGMACERTVNFRVPIVGMAFVHGDVELAQLRYAERTSTGVLANTKSRKRMIGVDETG